MLMNAFLALFYYSGLYRLFNRFLKTNGLFIVGYHRIAESADERIHALAVTDRNLEEHFRFYSKEFEVISMNDVERLLKRDKLDKDYLVVTFDDGYRDNYTLGSDLYEKYRIRPTVYLTAAAIDKRTPLWTDAVDAIVFQSNLPVVKLKLLNIEGEFVLSSHEEKAKLSEIIKNEIKRYDEQIKQEALEQLMNCFQTKPRLSDSLLIRWHEVRELLESGAIAGSHTCSHPTLSKIPIENAVTEIRESKQIIERHTRQEVLHFAYPYGKETDYSPEVKRELQEVYRTSVTAIDGVNMPGEDLHELRRIIVDNVNVHRLRLRLLKWKIHTRKVRRKLGCSN
jgi:peptidoglycan/xylan/chitin deacetylase (PgdA/CDA1 family)